MSKTQARQSHFSTRLMDSGGNAERSRAWTFFADFGRLAAGFRAAGFFNLDALADITPAFGRGAALLVCLGTGWVFRLGTICLFSDLAGKWARTHAGLPKVRSARWSRPRSRHWIIFGPSCRRQCA